VAKKFTGDSKTFAKSQLFAWEANMNIGVHQQADPTKLELLHKEFEQKSKEYAENLKESVLQKYVGEKYFSLD
jgi:pre-mRNA-processing factor SLU7